jgi:hypothetical protein
VSRVGTFIGDAVLLWLLTISIPIVILVVGAPLALLMRFVLEILKRL